MSQHKKWKRLLSSFVIFSLLASLTVWGNTAHAADAIATSFGDVPSGHWAEKHITKLALQGVVKGNNGLFKPNDNITQQEAVTLAVRFIGKESEATTDAVFPDNFKVGNYFKPYVVLAFQLGLLDRNEEFKLAEANKSASWGEQKASREWITKLLIRAIGQQKLADGLASTAIAFQDGNNVGTGYKGYVNAAVQLQLVKGVTAQKFDPKGSITRASIATMFSRAESQYPVTYAGQLNGVLSGKDKTSIKLYGADGEKTFNLTSQTYITRYDSEKSSTLDQLVLHTNVLIITSGDKVSYIEQLDDKQQLETISGDFVSVIPDKHILYILVQNEPMPITYNDSVVVKDTTGAVLPITSLPKDSKVQITRATYGKSTLALSVTVQSAPINKTGSGKATFIDAAAATLKVMNAATNLEETYTVSSKADVIWQGMILDGGISQIHVGDTITYEVVNSIITKVTVQQTSTTVTTTVRGQFYSASADGKTVSYKKNAGTPQEKLDIKFVTDSAEITIEGLSGTVLSDLIQGDVLDLTLNSSDQVTAIKVVNRKVVILNGVTVRGYDSTTKVLDITSAEGKLISLYLTDKTKIDSNGSSIPLNSVASLLVKNRKITLGYTDDKAVLLQFVYKYSGTVTSLNTYLNQVTIAQSNGTTSTLPLEYASSVDIAGKSSSTLADVKVGDTVTALLNANQDKAVTLQVHTAAQVEVVSVDAAGKKLKLKNSSQATSEYSASAWDLFNDNGDKITLSNISAGQIGNLTFVGSTPVAFATVKVTVGRVLAVTTTKLTVMDYNGIASDLPLGSSYTVSKNGVTSSSAGIVQIGDRVEVKKDPKGQVVVTIIPAVSKEFWKYEASSSVLSVKRVNLSESNIYVVTSKTKVTQGDVQISITQLKDGDKIALYFYQDGLLEIVKIS
ncbi:hypothetical protein Back11_10220 [Paenibacillus baekrokdamisoli]|uniref:Uncharacterized protein n=1 Tax=Paenibacillus baekrokdamisoli TaxID=1712516 RepID=A0A3G9IL79_9BACL|nr:S-layer homology domain-containing protein [Paenibacillus baekrokdamisoli]MBB3067130.1 hypothetical protein [Paenibacillus baekrokdamisoli]BBH19677.1 hypothetical protein Back11_10220 [Paenibacillus baekrokdamisoli]